MKIVIRPSSVYINLDDSLDYGSFGRAQISRSSHVEPDDCSDALEAELEYVNSMLAECEPLDISY